MAFENRSFDAVFYEAFEEEEKVLREFLPQDVNCLFTWKTIQESGHELPPSPIISTRTQSEFPDAWSPHLKAIMTRSTGYDHVSSYIIRNGMRDRISCAYLPDYAARAVAEQAMLLWTALSRKMKKQMKSFESFNRDGLTGGEVFGKTILVAGVGRIGSKIVEIASGLGMKVLGFDIKPQKVLEEKFFLKYVSLEDALPTADIVVCALPLTSGTEGLFNYALLSKVKKGAFFINIARGEISPSIDILKLLDESRLGGAGLDVYDCERELALYLRGGRSAGDFPDGPGKRAEAVLKMMERDDVVLFPHNAFNTVESVRRKCCQAVENLSCFLNEGRFLTPVEF
ncbi:MAG: hypothetical protein A2020_15700 [Lentisphaerae bacterium GWF2_45_14]|nr:MAG: hypothetical protein A2020_15700 [Lentisphaerae bacterium GWF2_45_14]